MKEKLIKFYLKFVNLKISEKHYLNKHERKCVKKLQILKYDRILRGQSNEGGYLQTAEKHQA